MGWLWWISALFFFFLFPLTSLSTSYTSDLFRQWCQQHGKSYSTEEENLYRFNVFEDNYAYIIRHNSNSNSSYTLSLNAFADLTHHEFKLARLRGLSASAASDDLIRLNRGSSLIESSSYLPKSLDWRDKGAVTNVKDQGSCGMCLCIYLFKLFSSIAIRFHFILLRIFNTSRSMNRLWFRL